MKKVLKKIAAEIYKEYVFQHFAIFHELYDFILKTTYDIDALHVLQMKK